jgi:type II secretory pathway component GspD/PulD (secretin)
MIRPTSWLLAIVLSVLVCIATTAGQQSPAAPPGESQPTPPKTAFNAQGVPWFSFSFPGGTVQEYVEVLRQTLRKNDQDANIILRAGAGNMPVPAVSLQAVTVEAALQILHNQSHRENDSISRLRFEVVHGGGSPIYILEAQTGKAASVQNVTVHVWNVSQLLSSGLKADDMLTAIESALALVRGEDEQAEVRFHEATGLIMARGTGGQISTMDQVVQQLHETGHAKAAALERERAMENAKKAMVEASRAKEELQATRTAATMMERERENLLRRNDALREEREMIANGSRNLQSDFAKIQIALEQAQMEKAKLEQELAELRRIVKERNPS